jgi:hypothetical protein
MSRPRGFFKSGEPYAEMTVLRADKVLRKAGGARRLASGL